MNIKISYIFLLLLVCSFGFSQEENTTNKNGTIEEQFNHIEKVSSNYKDRGKRYEVINTVNLNELKSNILDSLKTLKNTINEKETTITSQRDSLTSLNSSLNTTKTNLESTNKEKDLISLFGLQLSKTSYNLILWSIILLLLVLLLVFIFKFKNSNTITKEAKKSLEDVELEFEEHRRVALEREQKVRRQLQDEINKNKTKG